MIIHTVYDIKHKEDSLFQFLRKDMDNVWEFMLSPAAPTPCSTARKYIKEAETMTLIRQYVDALANQDALALSKLFFPTAIFVDLCPRDAGKPLVSTYGPEAIDMFYHNRFLFRHFRITDPRIVSDTQAYYYAVYDGYHVRALATITEFSSDGLIERLVVRPA